MTEERQSPKIDRYVSPHARQAIRDAIDEVDGAEVFFVGHVGESGMIEDAEARAFGNRQATPVIEQMARPGDVVIHNHPNGELEPSQADVEVAARFGNAGVGSYIVDNKVSRLRVIVPAMKPRERKPINAGRLQALLGPSGELSRSLPGYEHRPQQSEMLEAVARAFNDDGIAVIEAGTGTGKSLAYLLPAIHWAKANSEKVVVSTNTINLQEQLIAKDLPFLQKHLRLEFQAELMKGRGNYLCKRRAGYIQGAPDMLDDPRTVSQLRAIAEWAAKTRDGSLSTLSFIPDSEVWDRVACDPDNCTRIKCPHYNTCFFFQARRRASQADVIVANHHLVMADLALRLETGNYTSTAVLPPYQRIVFDEAHNIEDVATHYFGIRLTRRALTRVLSRLVHAEHVNRGVIPFLVNKLTQLNFKHPSQPAQEALQILEETLTPMRHEVARLYSDLMDVCAKGVSESNSGARDSRERYLRVTPAVEDSVFWRGRLREALSAATDPMSHLARGLKNALELIKKTPAPVREELDNPMGELKSLANRLEEKVKQLRHFYTIGENRCRWIEVRTNRRSRVPWVTLMSLPLDVRDSLNRAVYATTPTIVMTSATLAVEKRFDFFLGQLGLQGEGANPEADQRVDTLCLDTPFDYDRQAFVGVPVDLPEPRAPGFSKAATSFLFSALQVSRGSAFVLFTSYQQLQQFYSTLAPLLRPLGYSCLRQGDEDRQVLLQRFRTDRTSILFATSSFWEGVDVPGEALRLLVLVKLPFRVPTDPLIQARVERLEAAGIDSFNNYSVPQAVIRFKQGFGRLIRKRDDYGAALVLDRRVATKPYGRVFRNSLPVEAVHTEQSEEMLDHLREFFEGVPAASASGL